jgi:chromatin remodeling complex protein RSC6
MPVQKKQNRKTASKKTVTKSTKKSTAAGKKKVAKVVATKVSSKKTVVETATSAPVVASKREELGPLKANKESVLAWFEKMLEEVDSQVTWNKENKLRGPEAKFLRTFAKDFKNLKTKASRVLGKKSSTRRSNGNSGFLKPVKISKEMAKFTGWVPTELKSRVDVTKFICSYIKEHDLQDPKDRRTILADSKLKKLLKIGPSDPPLTYYRIQSYMKPHFSHA